MRTKKDQNVRPNGADRPTKEGPRSASGRFEKYQAWIDQRLSEASPQAQCAAWTLAMVAAFPELKRVRGHLSLSNGHPAHWWCETPDGEIVDPTVSQFGGSVVLAYLAHEEGTPEPNGKCLNCGEYVYAPRSSSCSETCDRELQEYYA